jgi:hypothetical protein
LHGETVIVLIQPCQYLSLAHAVTHIDVSCQQLAGHTEGQHRLIARSHVPRKTHHTVSLIHDPGDLHRPGHLRGLLVLMGASHGHRQCQKEDTHETCRETGTADSNEFHDVLLLTIGDKVQFMYLYMQVHGQKKGPTLTAVRYYVQQAFA